MDGWLGFNAILSMQVVTTSFGISGVALQCGSFPSFPVASFFSGRTHVESFGDRMLDYSSLTCDILPGLYSGCCCSCWSQAGMVSMSTHTSTTVNCRQAVQSSRQRSNHSSSASLLHEIHLLPDVGKSPVAERWQDAVHMVGPITTVYWFCML